MSEIIEALLRPIFELLLYVLGYWLGYLVVVVLSLGCLTPAPFEEIEDRKFRQYIGIRWWHLTYHRESERFRRAECVVLVGLASLATVCALIYRTPPPPRHLVLWRRFGRCRFSGYTGGVTLGDGGRWGDWLTCRFTTGSSTMRICVHFAILAALCLAVPRAGSVSGL